MKRLLFDEKSYLSYVKDVDFVTDGLFDLYFYKTVGDTELILTNLSDYYGLPDCKPYITLEADLSVNSLPVGEYLVELHYNGELYDRSLIEVYKEFPNPNGGSGTYKDVIVL
jgi:hypothetical protein